MSSKKIVAPLALVAASVIAFSGCAANEGALGGQLLTGKGASSMSVAQTTWIADFQGKNSGVTVNYSPDGSGAGRDAFSSGAAQFAGSDRAFKNDEMGAGKFAMCAADSNALNLPVYISPIALIYKVEGVTDLKLDAETIAGIFSGKITTWNDPKIAALNPGVALPAASITAVHRSDDSGTTENFTDYLAQAAPSIWTSKASGTWPKDFPGEAAKGTAGVVSAVESGANTIGYADESQAGSLGKAKVKVGGEFFGPTAEAAAKLVDNAKKVDGRAANDWALKLDRSAQGQYPITLISYAIVCETYKDPEVGKLVKSYLGYIVSDAGQKSAQAKAGNAPLSADMAAKLKTAVESMK